MFLQDAIEIMTNEANKNLAFCNSDKAEKVSSVAIAAIKSCALTTLTLCSSAKALDESAVAQVITLAKGFEV